MSRNKRRNKKANERSPQKPAAVPPPPPAPQAPVTEPAQAAPPLPAVETTRVEPAPAAPETASSRRESATSGRRADDRSTERLKSKFAHSERHLPAPLAVLDADYSEVLRMRNVRYMIVIGAVAGALIFGWYLSAIFVPLLIALGIAYVLNPLVEILERRGVSRLRAVVLIFSAFIAVSVAAGTWFVVSLAKDVRNISTEIGSVLDDIETKQDEWVDAWNDAVPYAHVNKGELTIDQVTGYLKEKVTPKRQAISAEEKQAAAETVNARAQLLAGFQRMDKDSSMFLEPSEMRFDTLRAYDSNRDGRVSPEEWFAHFGAGTVSPEGDRVLAPEAQRAAEGILGVVGSGLMSVLYIGLCLVLIPIYTWFFLLGLPGIMKSVDRYLPGAQKPRIRRIIGEIDGMAKSFFRGRLIVVIIISIMTTILFVALDVRYSFLLGLLAGVGIMVPFASFIMSMGPAAVLMAASPEPSWTAIIVMIAIFCAIQAFEQYVLTPKLLGDAVELHPVTLLVGVFVMTYLFGVFGALLAVPLTAIAKTMGREFLLPYFKSLADEPTASGQTRIIQKT
jgi:predicted PurR-regulated permease PerM